MHTDRISNDLLLQQLNWRYATKKFDPARKIADADWRTLEQTLVLTPSAFGLQPWKFLVITDPVLRESLVPVSWDQRQVTDCSHFVVFAVKTTLTLEDVDVYLRRMAEVRQIDVATLAPYRQRVLGAVIEGGRSSYLCEWMHRQAYIALGNFMTAAALQGIDTCAMEGYDPARYDEILGLTPRGLTAGVACAAGYRAADDKYAGLPKVRFPMEEMIERI